MSEQIPTPDPHEVRPATPAFINGAALALAVVLLAAGGPWLVGQLRSLPRNTALEARSGQKVVTLEVGGMTCSGCAGKITGELGAVAGVSDVDVRLAQRRAYVVCDKAVADSTLLGAVGRAGPGYMAAVVGR